jgi:hypothetical protein
MALSRIRRSPLASGFLVEIESAGQLLCRQVAGNPDRQPEPSQQCRQAVAGAGRAERARLAQPGCGHHADGDGFAVQEAPVGSDGLQGVAEAVAKIEQGANTGFFFVLRHDLRLVFDRTANQVVQRGGVARGGGVRPLLQPVEKGGVADGAVLDDFGQARAVLPGGQGVQRGGVYEHGAGLVKGADQVLALDVIDSRLAADRGVHLRQQGRRRLQETHAPHVAGRREAGDVADHAAAQGDQRRVTAGLHADQLVDDPVPGVRRLVLLAVGNDVDLRPAIAERCAQRAKIQRGHGIVADDQDLAGAEVLAPEPRVAQQSAAEINGVCAGGQAHVDDVHVKDSPAAEPESPTLALAVPVLADEFGEFAAR